MTKLEKVLTARLAVYQEKDSTANEGEMNIINRCMRECKCTEFIPKQKFNLLDLIHIITFTDRNVYGYPTNDKYGGGKNDDEYEDAATFFEDASKYDYLYLLIDDDFDDDIKGIELFIYVRIVGMNKDWDVDLELRNLNKYSSRQYHCFGRLAMMKQAERDE